MLRLALMSNKDLVKVIPLISLVIVGAPESLFLISRVFIITELTIQLKLILLKILWGVQMSLRNIAYEGMYFMALIRGW